MAILDNILNVVLPDYPMHATFKFADRFKPQHSLGLVLALCMIGFYAHVAQAGIGRIHQVQVSKHSPVPFDTVL